MSIEPVPYRGNDSTPPSEKMNTNLYGINSFHVDVGYSIE